MTTEDIDGITLNTKSAELLMWKLSLNDRLMEVMAYGFLGPGWDGKKAKAPTKQAIYRAIMYLKDLNTLTPLPVAAPLVDGSISFEEENGKLTCLITEYGMLLRERKAIDDYTNKIYGK